MISVLKCYVMCRVDINDINDMFEFSFTLPCLKRLEYFRLIFAPILLHFNSVIYFNRATDMHI